MSLRASGEHDPEDVRGGQGASDLPPPPAPPHTTIRPHRPDPANPEDPGCGVADYQAPAIYKKGDTLPNRRTSALHTWDFTPYI